MTYYFERNTDVTFLRRDVRHLLKSCLSACSTEARGGAEGAHQQMERDGHR